jgi:hypothetical protein
MKSTGRHDHDVVGINNVDLQFPNGDVKTIPHVFYSPSIKKILLIVGNIVDQHHSLEFFLKVTSLEIISPKKWLPMHLERMVTIYSA